MSVRRQLLLWFGDNYFSPASALTHAFCYRR
jgi:hypothetical protein